MKYIVTEQEKGREEIFIFPRGIDHDAMAEVLGFIKNHTHGDWERMYRKPIAAGFMDANFDCYGRSETLNLDSRGSKDTELVQDV